MRGLSLLSCFVIITLFTLSCNNSRSYRYPAVSLELVSAVVTAEGIVDSIYTDKGDSYKVVEYRPAPLQLKDTTIRAIIYLDFTAEGDAILFTISPVPVYKPIDKDLHPVDSPNDPVGYKRVWVSGGFLNMELQVKADKLAIHEFVFTEQVELETSPATVSLKLYHTKKTDIPIFTQNYILSIPLHTYYKVLETDRFNLNFIVQTDEGEKKLSFELNKNQISNE